MREDQLETLEKMFPQGFLLVHLVGKDIRCRIVAHADAFGAELQALERRMLQGAREEDEGEDWKRNA
jgi:hypothetical protein